MDVVTLLVVAFFVGIVVGLTGMGGGALMTPALIFLGVNPTVAVSNDLVAAAFSKTVGAATHWKQRSVETGLVRWLIIGSVPSAFAGGFIIEALGAPDEQQRVVKLAIGAALLFAAATYTLRIFITSYKTAGQRKRGSRVAVKVRPLPTILVGVFGGLLVGMTSVGAGSIIMIALLLLYPMLKPSRLVGTDLAQAVPLVVAAAVSHVITTGVDWGVLLPLIIGSVPGSMLGARLSGRVHQKVIRRSLVVVLLLTGLTLLGLPPKVSIALGVAALIVGPALLNYPLELRQKKLANIDPEDVF